MTGARRGVEPTSGTPGIFTASTISNEDWIGRRVERFAHAFGELVTVLTQEGRQAGLLQKMRYSWASILILTRFPARENLCGRRKMCVGTALANGESCISLSE